MRGRRGTPRARRFAKLLRKRPTPTENRVWQLVRNRRMLGLKFRRQHPIRGFVVDFYCAELSLVLEVEGDVHLTPQQLAVDRERAAILEGLGLRVLRIRNQDCTDEGIRHLIAQAKTDNVPPTSRSSTLKVSFPSPARERGQG